MEDFSEGDRRAKTQVNPANTKIAIRALPFLAHDNGDAHARQRLTPVVPDLIETVVISHMRAINCQPCRFTATLRPSLPLWI